MRKILVWGFYNQGNIGDDLMGAMIYELLEELGHRPIVFSANPRFSSMGYRATGSLQAVDPDLIILGGGAFFKKSVDSTSAIEHQVSDLARFMEEKSIPTHAVSLGSDGIDTLDSLSLARRNVLLGSHLKSATLRTQGDLALGLRTPEYLPDIVLLAGLCANRYPRLNPVEPCATPFETLINLSRRSVFHLPRVLWRTRSSRRAFFHAHTGSESGRGEINLPGFPLLADESLTVQLGQLRAAKRIVSSKLHPGVIAQSFGNEFEAVAPRPKTIAFLSDHAARETSAEELHGMYLRRLEAVVDGSAC